MIGNLPATSYWCAASATFDPIDFFVRLTLHAVFPVAAWISLHRAIHPERPRQMDGAREVLLASVLSFFISHPHEDRKVAAWVVSNWVLVMVFFKSLHHVLPKSSHMLTSSAHVQDGSAFVHLCMNFYPALKTVDTLMYLAHPMLGTAFCQVVRALLFPIAWWGTMRFLVGARTDLESDERCSQDEVFDGSILVIMLSPEFILLGFSGGC